MTRETSETGDVPFMNNDMNDSPPTTGLRKSGPGDT